MSDEIFNIRPPELYISSELNQANKSLRLVKADKPALKPTSTLKVRGAIPRTKILGLLKQETAFQEFGSKLGKMLMEISSFDIPEADSLTFKRTALISALGKMIATAEDRTELGIRHMEIFDLAGSQINISDKLISTDSPTLSAGDYTFDLTVGDDETQSVKVTIVGPGIGEDSNLDLLEKIGRQIMAASEKLETSITLRIEPDTGGVDQEWVTLTIKSKEPGWEYHFDLADTSGTMVGTLDLNIISDTAAQADFEYDHWAYSTNSNQFSAEGGQISVGMLKPTTKVESILIEEGYKAAFKQAGDLVEKYNDMIEFLGKHVSSIKPTFLNNMTAVASGIKKELGSIGINVADDGQIELTDRFAHTLLAQPDKVSKALNGKDGFFFRLGDFIKESITTGLKTWAQPIATAVYTSRSLTRMNQQISGLLGLSFKV